MVGLQADMVLQEEDLNETDIDILRLLKDGRCSPGFLASELDRQQPYVSQRLKRLVEHDHVRRVDRGLYELTDNPLTESQKRSNYRERALEHYGHVCDVCGSTENIVVHHRDGDRSNNDLPNLIPLCEGCHGKVHGRSDEVSELVEDLGYKPVSEEETTIRVSDELADKLYYLKGRSETYEDVLWQLLEQVDGQDEAHGGGAEPPTGPPQNDQLLNRERLRDELAGSDDLLERRVDEILTMYDLLRERGQAGKDELLDAVDVDATGYASRASVWSNMVKGKQTLSALPGVESPPTGRSEWRYTDE